jgi:hypothetical protein
MPIAAIELVWTRRRTPWAAAIASTFAVPVTLTS